MSAVPENTSVGREEETETDWMEEEEDRNDENRIRFCFNDVLDFISNAEITFKPMQLLNVAVFSMATAATILYLFATDIFTVFMFILILLIGIGFIFMRNESCGSSDGGESRNIHERQVNPNKVDKLKVVFGRMKNR